MIVADDPSLRMIACQACGFRLLVDPEHGDAVLLHHADGAHRAIADAGALDGITGLEVGAGLRVDILALAVQVDDVRTALGMILERLVEAGRRA